LRNQLVALEKQQRMDAEQLMKSYEARRKEITAIIETQVAPPQK
jgi:hypothetical protein